MQTARLLVLVSSILFGRSAFAEQETNSYVRSVKSNSESVVELQTAVRRFADTKGKKPDIILMSVAHIGNQGYYKDIQERLDKAPLVLFEGVGAPQSLKYSNLSLDDEIRWTEGAIEYLALNAKRFYREKGRWPVRQSELAKWLESSANKDKVFYQRLKNDAWRVAFQWKAGDSNLMISSTGPREAVTDTPVKSLLSTNLIPPEVSEKFEEESRGVSLYKQMADMIGVVYQRDGLDYNRSSFYSCDMSIEDMRRRVLEAGGAEGDEQIMSFLLSSISGENPGMMLAMGLAVTGSRLNIQQKG